MLAMIPFKCSCSNGSIDSQSLWTEWFVSSSCMHLHSINWQTKCCVCDHCGSCHAVACGQCLQLPSYSCLIRDDFASLVLLWSCHLFFFLFDMFSFFICFLLFIEIKWQQGDSFVHQHPPKLPSKCSLLITFQFVYSLLILFLN